MRSWEITRFLIRAKSSKAFKRKLSKSKRKNRFRKVDQNMDQLMLIFSSTFKPNRTHLFNPKKKTICIYQSKTQRRQSELISEALPTFKSNSLSLSELFLRLTKSTKSSPQPTISKPAPSTPYLRSSQIRKASDFESFSWTPKTWLNSLWDTPQVCILSSTSSFQTSSSSWFQQKRSMSSKCTKLFKLRCLKISRSLDIVSTWVRLQRS